MLSCCIAFEQLLYSYTRRRIGLFHAKYVIRRNRQSEYKLKVKLLRPALQAIASAHSYRPTLAAIQQATGSMQDPIKKILSCFSMILKLVLLLEALQSLQNVSMSVI